MCFCRAGLPRPAVFRFHLGLVGTRYMVPPFSSCSAGLSPDSWGSRRFVGKPGILVLSVVVAGLQTGYFDPLRPSPLPKQNAVTILRPVSHYFFHLQPCGAQLLDRNLLRDAVSAPVARNSFHRFQPRPRREIDNRQPPSALQGPRQAGVELRRL